MGLNSPTECPSTANDDIICYKFLIIEDTYDWLFRVDGVKLLSPFKRSKYKINKLKKSLLGTPHPIYFNYDGAKYQILEGLHTFKNKKDAIHIAQLCKPEKTNYVIAKCIIPSGAKFYAGHTNQHMKAFVSNKLVVLSYNII